MVDVALSKMESLLKDNVTELSKSNKGSIVTLSSVEGALSKVGLYFKELGQTTTESKVSRDKHNLELNALTKKLIRYV